MMVMINVGLTFMFIVFLIRGPIFKYIITYFNVNTLSLIFLSSKSR